MMLDGDGDEGEKMIRELVAGILPGGDVMGGSGNMKIVLPRQTLRHLPTFFAELKTRSDDLSVEWGISNSTLEEVFLRLVEQHAPDSDGAQENFWELRLYTWIWHQRW